MVFPASLLALESVQEQRHDLMEGVGDAAKTIGKMLKGEAPFDADAANEALQTWADAPEPFGLLFPDGSESGYDTEAKSTIWTDRKGFNEQLALFDEKASAAVAARPKTLEELNAAAGPVFKVCKACHEEYRVDDN
jgi:cytochrome c556